MALDLTPEQKETGKANFQRVVGQYYDPKSGVTRRDFMKGAAAAAVAVPVAAAAYYGYSQLHGKPVKAALIGAGDEGGVLVGEHNPEYLEFVAFSDIRPSNYKERIFKGEPRGPRRGFEFHYGKQARDKIQHYESYQEMLKRDDIEMVVIALPLNLHAPVAIDCMNAGKHVLCEKLMAWNVTQCKDMIRVAEKTDRALAIGHQRHYSLLYAHALEVMKSGVLGDVKHIRALWHRNNALPRKDKDGKEIAGTIQDSWFPDIKLEDRKELENKVKDYGFQSLEELVHWRIFDRTGGGLMAELGSHQLDACSIFLGKVHPLAVSGVGTKSFYLDQYRKKEREVDDHVFTTFEFPGKDHAKDPNDVVVVTYSSINTNSFEPYGECVMGSRGTMVVENEASVMLYGTSKSLSVSVSTTGGDKAALEASSSTGGPAAAPASSMAAGAAALGSGPPSRGYREEMEHFAYCVRMWNEGSNKQDRPTPRCHGKVAMADAIIALTSNLAMKHHKRIKFDPDWFDPASDKAPEQVKWNEVNT